jgi:putative transcriptional regulator
MRSLLTNRLAECRATKGIRKSQLAFWLQMSRGYVTRLERGEIQPSLEVALRIARYFKKPVEQIFQLVGGEANDPDKTKVVGSSRRGPATTGKE